MEGKLEFRSKLSGILELAQENDHRLAKDEVEKYFEEDQLTTEQMELVFDYLLSQKIAVKGYEKEGGAVIEKAKLEKPVYSEEEQKYLQAYLQDLSEMKEAKENELEELFPKLLEGDSLAKGRVTELYLKKVVSIAETMYRPEIFLGDLIQEGNVSLILALEMIGSVEDADKEICSEIKQGIQMLIEETLELKKRDDKMVQKVQEMDESITKLTEDLGRKVTIDELSAYMELTEAEIAEVLKLMGEETE